MADYTMCLNNTCPSCSQCYRYMASANPLQQSYANFAPAPGEDVCGDYLEYIDDFLDEEETND